MNSDYYQRNRLDTVIEWLMIGFLLFMPAAFGVVHAWSQEILYMLVAAIVLCFVLKLVIDRSARFIWSWTYLPIGIFVAICVLQLLPLPAGIVSNVSPATVEIKTQLLSDLPPAISHPSWMALSFYSYATEQSLRLVLAIASVFIVTVNIYRRSDQIQRLLLAITIIASGVVIIGIAQNLIGNGKIYWLVPTPSERADAGPFVNHSHYGQYVNLAIGAALGLLLVRVHAKFQNMKVTPARVFDYFSSPSTRTLWFLIGFIVVGVASIFISLTRGGALSLLIAAAFTAIMLSTRYSKVLANGGWFMVVMALGAFVCVLYMGFDAVYQRFATLHEQQRYLDRIQIVKDIAVMWTQFPLFGTGLGTHSVVYPMFDRSLIPALAAHAENEYAQIIEETGIIGLLTLIIFGIMIWVCYIRNIKHNSVPITSVAFGLGFGLLAILIHSLSDFGQHIPANAMLSAIFCGLLVSLVHKSKHVPVDSAHPVFWRRGFVILSLAVLCLLWGWILIGADKTRSGETCWKKAAQWELALSQHNWEGTDNDYIELLEAARDATFYQPDNIEYHHWLNVYRWRSISRQTDPNTGRPILPVAALGFVSRIADELHAGTALCPTYGASYCVLGQLQMFVLNDANGAEHIEQGFKLAPSDPTACFTAGLLEAQQGGCAKATLIFDRALKLDGRLYPEIADIYLNIIHRPDIAAELAGDDISRLSYLADSFSTSSELQENAKQIHAKVVQVLKEKCSKADTPAWALASLAGVYASEGNSVSAANLYRKALAIEYGNIGWRYALACVLADSGKNDEAIHEARICLRLRPQFGAAEKLIADLSAKTDGRK